MKNDDRPLIYVYFPPQYAFLFDARKGEGVYEVGCIAPQEGREGQSGGFSALFRNHVSTNVVFMTVLAYDATAEARRYRIAAFQERLQYELLRHGVQSRNDLGQGHVQGSLSSIMDSLYRSTLWCRADDASYCITPEPERHMENDDVCMDSFVSDDVRGDKNKGDVGKVEDMDISRDIDTKLRLR